MISYVFLAPRYTAFNTIMEWKKRQKIKLIFKMNMLEMLGFGLIINPVICKILLSKIVWKELINKNMFIKKNNTRRRFIDGPS